MPTHHLTLRVTKATDVERALVALENELAQHGVHNPPLLELVRTTAGQLKADLQSTRTPVNGSAGPSGAETVLNGEGYRIRITTRAANRLESLLDTLLRRPAAIS